MRQRLGAWCMTAASSLGALATTSPARASDIDPSGRLQFAGDALATFGFESPSELQSAGGNTIAWSGGQLVPTAMTEGDAQAAWTEPGDALEGSRALRIRPALGEGVALLDAALFSAIANKRITVTFWGRALGAEPALEVSYAKTASSVGPRHAARLLAVRTGRETSDGWIEYSTGPIDGSIWGRPIRSLTLTARVMTDWGGALLTSGSLDPRYRGGWAPDPTAYAVIDALEVRPSGDALVGAGACTAASVGTACADGAECFYGQCVDSAFVWGPLPPAAGHRHDLVERWSFVATSLSGSRKSAAGGTSIFSSVKAKLATAASPRAFYGELAASVAALRDSHARLGMPPSTWSPFYPLEDLRSGALDVCLGPASDDVGGGGSVFAVFASGGQGSVTESLARGDVLAKIDGQPPLAWLKAVGARYVAKLPSDPAADPAWSAKALPTLVTKYATTVTFRRCAIGRGCADLPDIPIAAETRQSILTNGYFFIGGQLPCTTRFRPAVSMPPADDADFDVVVAETSNGVTNVQFDGFAAAFDASKQSPFSAWTDPMTRAFQSGARVLVDAREGHGGRYLLGSWLVHLLRGSAQPYAMFAMPRGDYDDPDPAWLFDSRYDGCVTLGMGVDGCSWSGHWLTVPTVSHPPGEGAKIAWLNGDDYSMNDVVPRLLRGRTGFRIFAPHPTRGAFGQVSDLPPISSGWTSGTMQALDARFGATLAQAKTSAWESGTGVPPDEVVVQKVSDILQNKDTLLEAARAWLSK